MGYDVRPVTAERWADLRDLFGPRGGYANCWCMWWRVPSREFKGERNRAAFEQLVATGSQPGLLAYEEGRPVGWVSVAPLPEFSRVLRSRTLKPHPDDPIAQIWSINCFVVRREARGAGVATALLEAAVAHAADHGAHAVEGYPVDTHGGRMASSELYTGTLEMFRRAGFSQVEGRGGKRALMRRTLLV
jgi:GNAT superfamily N-acetyltransferase